MCHASLLSDSTQEKEEDMYQAIYVPWDDTIRATAEALPNVQISVFCLPFQCI